MRKIRIALAAATLLLLMGDGCGHAPEPFITMRGTPGVTEAQIQLYDACFFKDCSPDNKGGATPEESARILTCSQACFQKILYPPAK